MIITKSILWFSALGCGLLAGVYFAFSIFIMPALGRIEPLHAISAMNSINSTILRSLFMALFFGTTLASGALTIIGLLRRGEPGGTAMLAGGLIYIAGMFLCTVFIHVPLNNMLAAVPPAGSDAASVWARYLGEWTMWNHVRTISSTASCALYIAAIAAT
jgi:uncharacterized membrane protein